MQHNLIYSSCRESSDHGTLTLTLPLPLPLTLTLTLGPFNSWDRQPYIWERNPAYPYHPNAIPKYLTIAENFIFANYGAGQAVDNDDGSSYYDIRDNVFYVGGGLKSDYAGSDTCRTPI